MCKRETERPEPELNTAEGRVFVEGVTLNQVSHLIFFSKFWTLLRNFQVTLAKGAGPFLSFQYSVQML